MTANRNLLRMKFARVIKALAEESKCPFDEALNRFYSSMTYRLMRDGVSDMHCMSDRYLVEEILAERAIVAPANLNKNGDSGDYRT